MRDRVTAAAPGILPAAQVKDPGLEVAAAGRVRVVTALAGQAPTVEPEKAAALERGMATSPAEQAPEERVPEAMGTSCFSSWK